MLLDPQHAYTKLLLSAVPNPESGLRLEPLVRGRARRRVRLAARRGASRPLRQAPGYDAHRASCSTRCARPRPRDFEATLREVAAFGYEGVELFDLHGHEPETVAGWLRELGLVARAAATRGSRRSRRSCRSSPPRRELLGWQRLVVSWVDPASSTTATLARIAAAASAVAARASSSGTTTTTPRSSRASSTACRPAVFLELDAGWAWYAGADPVDARSVAARCVHIKDFRVRGEHSFCPVGDGAVGFERIVPGGGRAPASSG